MRQATHSPIHGSRDSFGPVRLQILLRVLDAAGRGGWPSIEDLAGLTGTDSANVHRHLRALRRDGLVAFENGRCRTLRPTCRFIPVSHLFPDS